MLTIARLRGSSLFIAVGFCLLASCKGKVEGDKPKPDEPALSKPAEDPALAKLQIPAPAAAPPPHATAVKEKPGEVISDDAPAAGASEDTASEPDDSDGDEEPATKSHKKKNKKKNGKAHKVHARKRASSSDDEPKDKREVKADAEDAHPDQHRERHPRHRRSHGGGASHTPPGTPVRRRRLEDAGSFPADGSASMEPDPRSVVRDKVRATIEVIRPAIQADGGDIFLRAFDEATGVVTVELTGACVSCPA